MLHPPKRYVFLDYLVEKKAFQFSKKTLHADTAHNKWLEKALTNLLTQKVKILQITSDEDVYSLNGNNSQGA